MRRGKLFRKYFAPYSMIIRKCNVYNRASTYCFCFLRLRLAKLIDNQPKRNKKSVRCLLHSLDSQRTRPLTPVWRDVWSCMQQECKKDVCIIEAPNLYATLETYLRKHRFCGECRTKVLKGNIYFMLRNERWLPNSF